MTFDPASHRFAAVLRGAAAFTIATLIAAPAAHAQTNVALGKPVTGSAFYDSGSETFTYQNITDGAINDTGAPGAWSFWLTPNGQTGFATIDLQSTFLVSSFNVQNTHNRGYNDRGTNGFTISTSLDNTVFSPVVISNLASVAGTDNSIPFQTFNISATNARYVRFEVTSYYGSSGGINELRVNGIAAVVPEANTAALLGCALPMIGGLVVIRRRKKK